MNKMIGHLLDLIYPRRCVFCDELLKERKDISAGDAGKKFRFRFVNHAAKNAANRLAGKNRNTVMTAADMSRCTTEVWGFFFTEIR